MIVSGVKRPSRASSRAPIAASGARDAVDGRRRMLSSPSSTQLPPSGCPASQPGSSRSSVPALPTSIAAPGRAPRRPGPWMTKSPRRAPWRTSAPSATHRVERRLRVGGLQVVGDAARARCSSRRAARRGGRATCRAAASSVPRTAGPGRKRLVHARATGRPSSATSVSAWRRALGAGDPQDDVARRAVGGRVEGHVGDVHAAAAEREGDLGDDAGAVGDRDAQLVDLAAGEVGLEQAAAVVARARRSTPRRRRRRRRRASARTAARRAVASSIAAISASALAR